MNADLVGPAGFRFGLYQGELAFADGETVKEAKRGEGRRSVGMDRLFQPDPGWPNDALS